MAGIDVSVGKELLPGLLGSQDGLAKLVEAVLNQELEAQLTNHWERSAMNAQKSVKGTGTATGHAPYLRGSGP